MCFLLSATLLFTLGSSKYKIYWISHRLRRSKNFSHFSHRGGGGIWRNSCFSRGGRGGPWGSNIFSRDNWMLPNKNLKLQPKDGKLFGKFNFLYFFMWSWWTVGHKSLLTLVHSKLIPLCWVSCRCPWHPSSLIVSLERRYWDVHNSCLLMEF